MLENALNMRVDEADMDGDGTISKNELRTVLSNMIIKNRMNIELTDEFLDQQYEAIDTNDDGELSPEELKEFVKQVLM